MNTKEQIVKMEEFALRATFWASRFHFRFCRAFSKREEEVYYDLLEKMGDYLDKQLQISIRDHHTPKQFEVIVCTDMRYLFHYSICKSWGAYDWSAFGFRDWKKIVDEYVLDR